VRLLTIPDPALVFLIGASGSGKSTWAAQHFRSSEVVSSDALRGVVGSDEHDLEASSDAFALVDAIVRARIGRGLTVVVDTLGMEPERRRRFLAAAQRTGLASVAVIFDIAPSVCRTRNRERVLPIPAAVLDSQLIRMRETPDQVRVEGWDVVQVIDETTTGSTLEPAHSHGALGASALQAEAPKQLSFILQLSAFPWGENPVGWLADVVSAAGEAGFAGIALMDHLIQIPQVGRAWDPLPEAFVTLGALAGIAYAQERSMKLGTLVTPVTFRSPGVVAKAVATLDVLSGGRAFCGIGAGWWDREHAAYGLSLPPVGERMKALATAIETLRALWSPGTKAYDGTHVSLPDTTLYPRPISDVPIIVGGGGERRTLRIAAEFGDGCNVRSDIATLDRKLAVLRAHCRDLGRDPAEVDVTVLDVPVVGRDRDEVASIVERLRGRKSAPAYAEQHHAATVSDHIGRYRMLVDRGVSSVFVAFPDLAGPEQLHRFAPVTRAFS